MRDGFGGVGTDGLDRVVVGGCGLKSTERCLFSF